MTYTYRGGKKLELAKRPDAFVARALPEALQRAGIADDAEQVSSASSRVRARAQDLDAMMARSRSLGPTHHAYQMADTGEDFLITDRVFVTFKSVLTNDQVAEFAGRYGLLLRERYTERDYLFQLTEHTGQNPVKLVVELTENDPRVELAENDLNYLVTKYELSPPSDPDYASQWHLHGHVFHPEVDPRANARCEAAWQLLDSFGSPEVVVGVTDDGCKLDHPDFDSPGKFAAWGYFSGTRLVTSRDVDAQPAGMYQAGANHGTSCAGVIAGEADAVLTVGAAPACRLLPIKWESQGPSLLINDSKMLTALGFVADKVDVLSNSWGSVPRFLFATAVINRLSQLAVSGGRNGRGILFLWAAGNENCPILHEADVDVPYTHGWEFANGAWRWAGPARTRRFVNNMVDVPGLMHVAALASTAQRSHYSNYGTGIEICAPSSNSHAYFRMQVAGRGVTTATGEAGLLTHDFGGTSSATPLVAGIAALVLSAHPALSAMELGSVLRRTAAKDLDTTPYPRTPAANFDPTPSWDVSPIAPFASGDFTDIGHADGSWSPWFGHGRVDAEQAVALALQLRGGGEAPAPAPDNRWTSRPGVAIPDNRPGGIVDVVQVDTAGQVSFVRVSVDIRHSYIGDLVVSLSAPSGHEVVLHDRAGGGRDDLAVTWEALSLPALRGFEGEEAAGPWTLSVRDEAAVDTGRLEEWSLELGVLVPPRTVFVEDAPGASIPDNRVAGITRTLAVTEVGQIAAIEVAVDITHTYIGDLRVTLHSPGGTAVVLHNRSGGGTDNLRAQFVSADVAVLQALAGEPCAGKWKLQVQDLAARDVGKLNRWSLDITLQAAAPATARPKKKAASKAKAPARASTARAKAAKPKRAKAKAK
ncbi:MAG: proprotein convertase P-domain-containing protein [Zoogloeaceae bacterium]|uniref:proprotein convertase P-domain-containing protein n=1 Tax=Denitromonas sp. TaxID=2734609 RepID=UPI001D441CE0|nr:proprotein convertase P-domain-containing protein [Rhodocyclaceae bacterium]MCP5223414.1 proprotein convertase P-domain-containing protein [Zoogloeaceae bacterium]HPR05839.1 proprotein convertase P-domain-containing protein [Denitromonas sp.]